MDSVFRQIRERLEAHPAKTLNLPGLSLREAAVLAPLFVRDGEIHALFTRRPMTLRTHAGQISFPGGGRDAADPTPLHTALRETHEELGIPPERVEVLGMLDELPTITEFRIVPFVGVIPGDFVYRPNPEEIEEIIEVPLAHLLNPTIHRIEKWQVHGEEHDVYFYDYGHHHIWGVTARILKGFLQRIGDLPAFEERLRAAT
ncbi:MAG: CoA pyrophosphatase [Myxococcaceae bacterium]